MPAMFKRPSDRELARVAPLSVLPVFVALRGKRAIVAGGSDAAAWKAELLAAAGALVHVYMPAESLSETFRRMLATENRLIHHDRPWGSDIFGDAALAVADAHTEADAEAFRIAARTAGTPVNVIDRPTFSDFQFGTIVNRSPVVVGISTGGAAPILAQAIRRSIEALLPLSLSLWGALAGRIRNVVHERLRSRGQRRAFWEALVDRAFAPFPAAADEDRIVEGLVQAAMGRPAATGRVTLVGAGPGDPELLTLKAVRTLQAADVILFDDLVPDAVLELARREARRIPVGKRAGRPSCRQEWINDLMVQLARSGDHVVRLKSGDPTIFGRAGEEIARLDAAGIPVEIVPGITAGIAMAAALGATLTHRDHAQSVRFITGHSHRGGLPEDLDWRSVADPSTTTVLYMGARTAAQMATRLMAYGLSARTSVAVGSAVSRPSQDIERCTLATLASTMAGIDHAEPVIIGIGPVFGTRGRPLATGADSSTGSLAQRDLMAAADLLAADGPSR